MRSSLLVLLLVAAVTTLASAPPAAALVPGLGAKFYSEGSPIPLKVNKLTSTRTLIDLRYYSLPFCKPDDAKLTLEKENLGEVLAGDTLQASMYHVLMGIPAQCALVCPPREYDVAELEAFAERIEENYRVQWTLDSLPVATKKFKVVGKDANGEPQYFEQYELGYPLGFIGDANRNPNTRTGVKYVNNHVVIRVAFHPEPDREKYRVVGFEVEAMSVRHVVSSSSSSSASSPPPPPASSSDASGDNTNPVPAPSVLLETCPVTTASLPQPVSDIDNLDAAESRTIIWTYDVVFEESSTRWANRWRIYLDNVDPEEKQVELFSVVNASLISLFLAAMVAMVMFRTLNRDLVRYNDMADDSEERGEDDSGWKQVHGEVFRPPRRGALFSLLVGTGAQLGCMTFVMLLVALLGVLSPANPGMLLVAMLLLFAFMGVVAGYTATRVFKMFKLVEWRRNTLMTAIAFPGLTFFVFFVLNLMMHSYGSQSGSVDFSTLVSLLVLWLGISTPLVYIGSYFAFRKPTPEPPVPVNAIPRLVPPQPWYMAVPFSILVGGVLPFGAAFIQVFFLLSSAWGGRYFAAFSFLFVTLVIVAVTCAEISIVMVYFCLCGEDYHWWWRAFLTPASSGVFLFAYSLLFLVRAIYSAIKID